MKWQRLTILDFMLLAVAYALAGACCSRQHETVLYAAPECIVHYTATEIFFQIVVLGNVFAGPIILIAQYIFRRRRTWPGIGEWLWLSPMLLVLASALAIMCWPGGSGLESLVVMLMIGGLALGAALSLLLLGFRLLGIWNIASCRWTDVFGCMTCLCVGIWALYWCITDLYY
jgi:hypothetical protein